jgi:type IV secretion/conjugal transfer VirB4 family ATPase
VAKLSNIVKDYAASGAVNTHVNLFGFTRDGVLLTKSGDQAVVLRVAPPDYECLDPDALAEVTQRFAASMRLFDPSFRFYQYAIKRSGARAPASAHHSNPVVERALRDQEERLDAKADNLYELEIYFVIIYEGSRQEQMLADQFRLALRHPISALKAFFSTDVTIRLIEEAIERGEQILLNKVNGFIVQMRDTVPLRLATKQEAFTFYRRLLNFDPVKADSVRLQHERYVDFYVCDTPIECYRDHLRMRDHFAKTLTLNDLPAETYPNMLRVLQELPSQFVIAVEFIAIDNFTMRGVIKGKQRHAFNSKKSLFSHLSLEAASAAPADQLVDESQTARVDQLGQCLTEIEMKGGSIGLYTLTVVLYDTDFKRLQKSAAGAFKSLAGHGATLYEEGYNQLNAFMAMLPGGSMFNLRGLYLPSNCIADMSLLFAPHRGEPIDRHLRADCLATLETRQQSLFSFNLHHYDIGHSLANAPSGKGKSFVLNFLITCAQKYAGIRTVVFDIGGSYEMLTRQFGGSYMPVALKDRPFKINPFCLPPTQKNLQFLFSFVKVLIESSGTFSTTDQDERELFTQISSLYHLDPPQRRLGTLLHILPKHLEPHLRRWTADGQYGDVFDNAEDSLTFATFQTFDFAGMAEFPQVIEPLWFYVLHRTDSEITDPAALSTFKTCVFDEAWLFVRNATVKQYIVEAMKTWRKSNAAMILATQSVGDLSENGILQTVVENCANLIFLANPRLDRHQYAEFFKLNETELDLIAGLIPKQEMLIKRPDLSKVVELNVSAKDYWLFTNNAVDNDVKRRAFEKLGLERGLDYLENQQRAIDNSVAEGTERTKL